MVTGTPPQGRRPRRILFWVLCLAGLLLLFWGYHIYQKRKAAQAAAARAAQMIPPIPVVVAPVVQKDVPIYLDGLGTVQAFNSVTIHVRVDGQITHIGFKEGQDVKKGDLLLRIDPAAFEAQLMQAEAGMKQNEALLANARRDLQRNIEMYESRVIAQQQYDTQVALVEQLEAAVAAGEAAIAAQRVQLGYTSIRAPIDGRVGLRLIDQGNIVHANDQTGILVINQLHPISVVFTLPEKNLFAIQTEMARAKLPVYALDRENTGPPMSEGTLTVVDNQVDTNTGTVRLKATFSNDDLHLWPGQFVNTRLLLTTRRGGIVVPAAAIQRGPEGSFAFVVKPKPGNTVEVRAVKPGQTQLNETLIEEGLQPGETVVVEGQYRLQGGSAVKIIPPAQAGSKPPAAAASPSASSSQTPQPAPPQSKKKREPKAAIPLPTPRHTTEEAPPVSTPAPSAPPHP